MRAVFVNNSHLINGECVRAVIELLATDSRVND